MKKALLLFILGSAAVTHAQATPAPVALMPNAVAVCQEGGTITSMPVGTVYQLGAGAGSANTPPIASTAATPKLPFVTSYSANSYPLDPAPNVLKTFYVQQTAVPFGVS